MFYRETGQFRTSYAADMAIFPLREDRIGIAVVILAAYALAFTGSGFLLNAVIPEAAKRLSGTQDHDIGRFGVPGSRLSAFGSGRDD